MSVSVKLAATIPLMLKLGDGLETKFVRAIVRNFFTDALIPGCPAGGVNLSHKEDGVYTNTALLMPGVAYVRASYEVFEDAGFTTPSTTQHYEEANIFELNTTVADVLAALGAPSGVDLIAVAEQSDAVVEVEDGTGQHIAVLEC